MSNVFTPMLDQGSNQGQVFAQPSSSPVDNTTASIINAASGFFKIGTDAYKEKVQNDTLKNAASVASKYAAAVAQGSMTNAERTAKLSAYTSSLIVDNPHLAPEIKQTVIAVNGTDPTTAQYEEMAHAEKEIKGREDASNNSLVGHAVNNGFVIVNPKDNSLDEATMKQWAIKDLANKHELELAKAARAALPSTSEREEAFRKDFDKPVQDYLQGRAETLFNQIGLVQVDPITGKYTPEQEKQLVQGYTAGVEKSVTDLRQRVIAAGGTAADADYYETKFRNTTDKYKGSFTGEYGVTNVAKNNYEIFKSEAQLDTAKKMDISFGLSNIGVALTPTDISTVEKKINAYKPKEGDTLYDSYYATSPKVALAKDLQSALQEGKPFSTFTPKEQDMLFPVIHSATKGLISKDFTKLPPEQRTSLANGIDAIAVASTNPATQADYDSFAKYFNKSEVVTALSNLADSPATSGIANRIATRRLATVESEIKKKLAADPSVTVDPVTGKVNGDPYLESLIGNINTLYPLTSRASSMSLQEYRTNLFTGRETGWFTKVSEPITK